MENRMQSRTSWPRRRSDARISATCNLERYDMTLDEAIVHARETAFSMKMKCDTRQCGLEHLQLAKWLEELKSLRAALKPVLEVALSYEDGEPIGLDDGEVCTDSEYAVSVDGRPIDDHTLAGCLAAVREARRVYDKSRESEIKE